MSDITLRADIEAELDFEPSLTAAGIGVTVKNGITTLTGHVPSYFEKIAAERAASRVKGVRALVEELEVRLAFDNRHDDEEIAARAANVLAWSVSLPADAIHLKVENGWITLTGEISWQYQKMAAASAVRRLDGVKRVINLITVRPQVSVGDVREQIAQAYRRNADFDASGIEISVDGSTVTLSGEVRAWGERLTAENAAWAIPSVTAVVDNLLVT
jgi:osmotically-inducible protein OsmY